MKTVLIFGNCQANAISKTMNLDKDHYEIYVELCYLTKIEKEEFTNIITKCDIIITQPISDNYRDVDYLNTSYIIENARENCNIFIFDSCYFDLYYPDLSYIEYNSSRIKQPIDYHYKHMIDCYKNNVPIKQYIKDYVNNENFLSYEELELIANDNFDRLKKRSMSYIEKYSKENVLFITTYEYIYENYKDKLLFYSVNHPTKYLLQYICEMIIGHLQIENTINYELELLNNTKCILYKCIQKIVNFDINDCDFLTKNANSIYDITKLYYDTYHKINF